MSEPKLSQHRQKISPRRLRSDLRRCAAPPSRPRDALGTLWDALGTLSGRPGAPSGRFQDPLGSLWDAPRTLSGRLRSNANRLGHAFGRRQRSTPLLNGLANEFLSLLACHAGAPMRDPSHFYQCFCRCRTICASQAPRTAKPRKNIPFELDNRHLGRPGCLPDGWWEQKNHVR